MDDEATQKCVKWAEYIHRETANQKSCLKSYSKNIHKIPHNVVFLFQTNNYSASGISKRNLTEYLFMCLPTKSFELILWFKQQ